MSVGMQDAKKIIVITGKDDGAVIRENFRI
jgi:hypothetical protein